MSELPDFDNDRSGFRAYVHKELRRAYDIGGMWALDEAWRLLGTWLGPSCAAIVLRHRAGETVYEDRTIISFAADYWPLTVLEGRARKARGLLPEDDEDDVNEEIDELPEADACDAAVDHPAHYQFHGHEVIDVIEAWGLDFCRGNAVKYIARAGRKGSYVEDLKKAVWYLQREIDRHSR